MNRPVSRGARFDQVDDFIEREYIAGGRLAGAQLAINHRGAVHQTCFGYLDRERLRPMVPDAMFRIFSMTKPITCVAFMMLVEEGHISLEDPVSRYIPAWSNLCLPDGTPCRRAMRVVDLLCHTSGLTYGIQYRTAIDARYRAALSMRSDGPILDEFITVLSALPLEFEPGTAWNYSVSTDVLGYLIERVSGQRFDEFLQARILQPLGMTDTAFFVPSSDSHRLAECYVRRESEMLGLPGRAFETDRSRPPIFLSGGGGLISTAKDYLSFCNAIVRDRSMGDGRNESLSGISLDGSTSSQVRLLTRATLELMSTNHLPLGEDLPTVAKGIFSDAGQAGIGFGLGWATTVDKTKAIMPGNPGDLFWSGMANTFFWCDPSEELSCVFMTQLVPADIYPLQREIKTLVYDALREEKLRQESDRVVQ